MTEPAIVQAGMYQPEGKEGAACTFKTLLYAAELEDRKLQPFVHGQQEHGAEYAPRSASLPGQPPPQLWGQVGGSWGPQDHLSSMASSLSLPLQTTSLQPAVASLHDPVLGASSWCRRPVLAPSAMHGPTMIPAAAALQSSSRSAASTPNCTPAASHIQHITFPSNACPAPVQLNSAPPEPPPPTLPQSSSLITEPLGSLATGSAHASQAFASSSLPSNLSFMPTQSGSPVERLTDAAKADTAGGTEESLSPSGGQGSRSCEESTSDPTAKEGESASGKKMKAKAQSMSARQLPDDGHQWHKYGHKTLMDSSFSRAYYRCAQRAQGCLAKKTVDFPLKKLKELRITYDGNHNHVPSSAAYSASAVVVRHKGQAQGENAARGSNAKWVKQEGAAVPGGQQSAPVLGPTGAQPGATPPAPSGHGPCDLSTRSTSAFAPPMENAVPPPWELQSPSMPQAVGYGMDAHSAPLPFGRSEDAVRAGLTPTMRQESWAPTLNSFGMYNAAQEAHYPHQSSHSAHLQVPGFMVQVPTLAHQNLMGQAFNDQMPHNGQMLLQPSGTSLVHLPSGNRHLLPVPFTGQSDDVASQRTGGNPGKRILESSGAITPSKAPRPSKEQPHFVGPAFAQAVPLAPGSHSLSQWSPWQCEHAGPHPSSGAGDRSFTGPQEEASFYGGSSSQVNAMQGKNKASMAVERTITGEFVGIDLHTPVAGVDGLAPCSDHHSDVDLTLRL